MLDIQTSIVLQDFLISCFLMHTLHLGLDVMPWVSNVKLQQKEKVNYETTIYSTTQCLLRKKLLYTVDYSILIVLYELSEFSLYQKHSIFLGFLLAFSQGQNSGKPLSRRI